MNKHIKVYRNFFSIGDQDVPFCEHCKSSKSVEIHHIFGRGKGKDIIENLVGLCRQCHKAAHNESKTLELSREDLITIHRYFIMDYAPDYRFNIERVNELLYHENAQPR